MKIFSQGHFKFLALFIFLFTVFSACSASRTYLSIMDRDYTPSRKNRSNQHFISVKKILTKLSSKNKFLAFELGKLPEFQRVVSSREKDALLHLSKLYYENSFNFNRSFTKMCQVGLAGEKKFNTPLQALFWLVQDEKKNEAKDIIKYFSLKKLLDFAWVLEHTKHIKRWKWRLKEAGKLLKSCLDDEIKRKIEEFHTKNKGSTDYTISMAKNHPEAFEHKFKPFNIKLKMHKNRWKDFNTVVDRINSPELVLYYIKNNFSYEQGEYESLKKTFKVKSGNSRAIAELGQFLLKKAGYKTFIRTVKTPDSSCGFEHTGAGIIMDDGSYLLVVDFPKGKNIAGPYDLISLDKRLMFGNCLETPKMEFLIRFPDFI
jgi:hypothetical protein